MAAAKPGKSIWSCGERLNSALSRKTGKIPDLLFVSFYRRGISIWTLIDVSVDMFQSDVVYLFFA